MPTTKKTPGFHRFLWFFLVVVGICSLKKAAFPGLAHAQDLRFVDAHFSALTLATVDEIPD